MNEHSLHFEIKDFIKSVTKGGLNVWGKILAITLPFVYWFGSFLIVYNLPNSPTDPIGWVWESIND